MAKLASFIESLALVTGVKSDNLKAWLETNQAIEIPDEVVSGINGAILTKESAKNNSEIIDHIRATAFNGIDTELERFMEDNKIDKEIVDLIKSEKKTGKKATLLASKLKEAEAAKINATGGDKKVLGEQIEKLKQEIADLNAAALKQKTEFDAKVTEAKNEFTSRLRDYQTDKHFQAYTYANDKIPIDVHIMTAKGLFDKKAKELGLKTVFDEETGQVKLLTSTDSVYFKDNKPVDFKSFTDSLLAENHLLKVSEPPKQEGGGNPPQIVLSSNGQGKIDNSRMTEALNKSLAEVNSVKTN